MAKHGLWWFALALTAAAAGAADAPPTGTGAPIKDWSEVETVVVTARPPGPPLWHVARGDSEVWIVPTVGPVPKDLTWDTGAVAERIRNANAVLLPPRGEVGAIEGLWFWMTDMDTLEQPDGTTLEQTLPGELRGRFVATRTRIGRDADRYGKLLGAIAALRLENDYWDFADLVPNGAQETIEHLASRAGVRARAVAVYPAMDVVRAVPKMTAEAHRICLDLALDDIATQSAHAAAAARAWADGDLDGIKAHVSEIRLDDCMRQNAVYDSMRETALRDETNAILGALSRPGKTVAVMPMSFFLRKGGVLERLEAAGLTVEGP